MAKSKKTSVLELKCTESGDMLYVKGGNRQGKEKLEIRKYNKKLRKHTTYKEKK